MRFMSRAARLRDDTAVSEACMCCYISCALKTRCIFFFFCLPNVFILNDMMPHGL